MDIANALISLVVLIAFVTIIYKVSQNASSKKLTLGQFLNHYFMRNETSIILGLVVLMNIMESTVASAIHQAGKTDVNPIARALMHLSFGTISAVCAINAPKKFMEFGKLIFLQKNDKGVYLDSKGKVVYSRGSLMAITFLIGLMLSFLAIILPYWNVRIMATGLGEQSLFDIAVMQIFPWNKNFAMGLPPNYKAVDLMSMYMQASFYALQAHLLLTVADGLYALYDFLKYRVDSAIEDIESEAYNALYGKKPDAKSAGAENKPPVTPPPAQGSEQNPLNTTHSKTLTKILEILSISSANRAAALAMFKDAFSRQTQEDIVSVSSVLTEFITAYESLKAQKTSMGGALFDNNMQDLRLQIREALKRTPKEGGLAIDLPS